MKKLKQMHPKISLVMATYGRFEEVRIFMESLLQQSYLNYELIIIDQNECDSLKNIIEKYRNKLTIKYIHSNIKGLSKCRNIGLEHVDGDIVAFPDDDCEYPKGLLNSIVQRFQKNQEIDLITFKSIDKNSKKDSGCKWLHKKAELNVFNLEKTAISYTIFIKVKDLSDIWFDDRMGVGEYFGSAEETDMLSTLLYKGYKGLYYPELYAYHPIKEEVKNRYYRYSLGMGAYIKKEISSRSKYKYLFRGIYILIIKPLGGELISLLRLNKDNMIKYFYILKGRIKGFIEYKI